MPEHESLFNPEFWVGVAFLGFIALLIYYKVPALISKALDDRSDALRKEIEEARKLRDEAATAPLVEMIVRQLPPASIPWKVIRIESDMKLVQERSQQERSTGG